MSTTNKVKFQNALVRNSGKKDLILELTSRVVIIRDYIFESLDDKTFTIKNEGRQKFNYSDVLSYLFTNMKSLKEIKHV